jgi:hypothetical protein
MDNEGSEKMKLKCDECSGNLEIDLARAEGTCVVCSLVHEVAVSDADTNSSSAMGEEAHVGKVNDGDKAGTKMPTFNNKGGDGKALTPEERRKANRLARLDRNTQRERDPMCRQLIGMMREMFGHDLAHVTRFLAEATARKLTPSQEATRATLHASARDRLACPKTSICRAGGKEHPELRGENDLENLQIMALAIASLSAKWFGTVGINEKAMMDQYGITKAQLNNAKSTISDHYKERISQGWALPPARIHVAANRADALDMALDNIFTAVGARLSNKQVGRLLELVDNALSDLDEPRVDGPMANVPVAMVTACVVYAVLQRLNLHDGNLNRVAKSVGLTGAGVKNRLGIIKETYDLGQLDGAEELFKAEPSDEELAEETEENAEE